MYKITTHQPLLGKAAFVFIISVLIKFLFSWNTCFAQEAYPFLNRSLGYKILERDDYIFRLQPSGTCLVIVDFKKGNIEANYRYYVKGEINTLKLHLIEYDFFSRLYLRNDIVSIEFLNILDEKTIFQFHKKIYEHFHALRNLKYPYEVTGVHKTYLEILESASGYLDFGKGDDDSLFANSTVLYRIMEIYNAYTNQKRLLEATLILNSLLETNGIQPY